MNKGFTLLELLITIVVIVILASIAIPAYIKTVEKSKAEAVILNLKTIRMGEGIYRIDNDTYVNCANLNQINNILKLDIEDGYYTYNVSGATANTFTAAAQRNSGAPAGYASTTITLTVTIDPSTGAETITWGGTSPFVP